MDTPAAASFPQLFLLWHNLKRNPTTSAAAAADSCLVMSTGPFHASSSTSCCQTCSSTSTVKHLQHFETSCEFRGHATTVRCVDTMAMARGGTAGARSLWSPRTTDVDFQAFLHAFKNVLKKKCLQQHQASGRVPAN